MPDLLATQLTEEAPGHAGQVVAEGVVGGEDVEGLVVLVLDQVAPDGLHVLGVRGLGGEGVVVALGPTNLVRVGTRVEEDLLVAVGDIHDSQGHGAAHGAEQEVHLVLLDHLGGLLHAHARVRLVVDDRLQLSAEHAAGRVDLLGSQLAGLGRVVAHRGEEAGQGDEVSDLDRLLLRPEDGRCEDLNRARRRRGGGSRLQKTSSGYALFHGYTPFVR
ncbi:MAG TPA: hypothetical protein VF464_10660 [Candidatus Methylomirabilis sp.]